MCKYCENLFSGDMSEPIIDRKNKDGKTGIQTYIDDVVDYTISNIVGDKAYLVTELYSIYPDEIVEIDRTEIHYCPVCGRELKKEA